MRTTLNVDDDVLEFAKGYASIRGLSVGEALSRIARRAMKAPARTRLDPVSGLMVLDTGDDVPEITSEDVQRAINANDREDAERYLGQYLRRDVSGKP